MPPIFNLQSVLDVRHTRVEALEIEFGKMLALQQEAQKFFDALLLAQADLHDQLASAQTGELDLVQISALRSNILQNDERIKRIGEELEKLNQMVDAKRREMIEAKQDEETLQILKRKRIDLFNAEETLRESRTQDDIYIAQAFRLRQQNT
jgi:flagellar export protein FliJ